jgi:hypothetical protein
MAFPIVRAEQADDVRAGLRAALRDARGVLHYYELPPKRRIEVVRHAATLPWEAALVVCQMTSRTLQERSRSRILANALPRLDFLEGVTTVVLESRAHADRRDLRTRDRLRGSRSLGDHFAVEHAGKQDDELVWLADLVVGAFVACERRGITESWELLEQARPIEITWLPHERA